MSSNKLFFKLFIYIYIFFTYIRKTRQLNIINIIKKDYKKARERYQSLSKKEKVKNRQCDRTRYKNQPEDEKQKLIEYRKAYYKMRKNASLKKIF